MLDLFSLLRTGLSEGCGGLTGCGVLPEDFRPAAGRYAAKSAFTLRLGLQADETARLLHSNRAVFTLWGMPFVDAVFTEGGHILFSFTDCFYDKALNELLGPMHYPSVLPLPGPASNEVFHRIAPRRSLVCAHAVDARICYVQRRMWMLCRRCTGEPICAAHDAARRALLLIAGLYDGICKNRKERLLDCLDALLYMTSCVSPNERRELHNQCAHIARLAAGVLYELYELYDHQKGRIDI